ncbi:hypothetical protein M0638_04630 [Roseomonas sp. NAR14]|uniref:Uncharacterized protein n=1 Tax=Roseomonas acroporae TaxID=2937791 RepID=A0A9X1Y5W2_9PROT|nr:hypothetical protein [Roseomonas acroporae]MCK8783667.1 hypothetical protein [Roseomonas acroporae]
MDGAARLIAFPASPQDRLRLSARRLEAALQEQAEAIRDFHASVGELSVAMGRLRHNVGNYRAALDELADSVAAVPRPNAACR